MLASSLVRKPSYVGMLSTLVGRRVPKQYHRFLKLPERPYSQSIMQTERTALGRAAQQWIEKFPAYSGVYRLDLGFDALNMRLCLIDLAESSIDIQSYLVRDDLSGNLIVLALLRAANRGVRIRLLMDDALTQPVDPGLLAISAHSNIEVRVFNPFPRTRSRFVSFVANFNILNRRMHNKSFTVDHQMSIVGGRNLADEYFQSSHDSEFLDEDLLSIGSVVSEVAKGFDEYWNTRESMPIEALSEPQEIASIEQLMQEGEQFLLSHKDDAQLQRLDNTLGNTILKGQLPFVAARAKLVLDHPDKVRGLVRRQLGETTNYLRRMASSAENELIIVSPYFVPLKQGVQLFSALVRNGVRVVIVTNSLASTNHSSVHAVYARYRKPLLRQGVELYELRPKLGRSPQQLGTLAKITLHSKVAVADRSEVFVGSFNLDPRSLYINTEMGMAVESDSLAATTALSILDILPQQSYALKLAPNGGIRWTYQTAAGERVAKREPHTTIWRRLATRLMSWLPIESQM